jgi:hypothetical protein
MFQVLAYGESEPILKRCQTLHKFPSLAKSTESVSLEFYRCMASTEHLISHRLKFCYVHWSIRALRIRIRIQAFSVSGSGPRFCGFVKTKLCNYLPKKWPIFLHLYKEVPSSRWTLQYIHLIDTWNFIFFLLVWKGIYPTSNPDMHPPTRLNPGLESGSVTVVAAA